MIKLINLLKENLEEKQLPPQKVKNLPKELYHFTSWNDPGIALEEILNSGVLKPSSSRNEKYSYISFTSNKDLHKRFFKSTVRLIIDSENLNKKYELYSYAQTRPETERDEEDFGEESELNFNEDEYIIKSKDYGGKISILPYIKQIDISLKENELADKDDLKYIKKLTKLANTKNIPVTLWEGNHNDRYQKEI